MTRLLLTIPYKLSLTQINLYNHIERQRMIERTRANRELASTLVQQLNEKHHRELGEKNMDKKEARLHQSLIYTEGLRP